MQTRKLGNSDLQVSSIGLGTWAIGGGNNPYGWGPQSDRESIATIQRAIDLGVNWLDTARVYGRGHSEEVVGRAIKGRREQVIVASKCGLLWKPDGRGTYGSLKAESIRQECHASLKSLGTDVIDLYQIHWPQPDDEIEEGWGAVADLVREGKVRYAGVSNFSVPQMQRAQAIHPITSLQPPYSMFKREIEAEILPYCRDNAIGVIVYSPIQAGLLSGGFSKARAGKLPADDWRKSSPDFQEPALSAHLWLVEQLRPLAARKGTSVANLAIAWVLRRPEVTAAIVGARRPEQIEETAAAGDLRLTLNELAGLEKLLVGHAGKMNLER